uniref:Uncharacterized protein n=1 Tax=Stomoxys calcitrans TaxID=35570 RepID=A0A1I8QA52_STOCA
MITHASSYGFLRQLKLLGEPTVKLSNDDNLQLIRFNLRKHMKDAFERNQNNYNLRARVQNFNGGQIVYRRDFAQSNFDKAFNSKLAPVFIKARVKEKLGRHYYVLEDLDRKQMGTYYGKDIRR